MKKTTYLFLTLFVCSLSANAYVDTQFTTSEQFFVNQGYSKEMARQADIQKKNPYEPVLNVKDTRTRFQKIYDYVDPCSNANLKYPTHSIEFNEQSINDL